MSEKLSPVSTSIVIHNFSQVISVQGIDYVSTQTGGMLEMIRYCLVIGELTSDKG